MLKLVAAQALLIIVYDIVINQYPGPPPTPHWAIAWTTAILLVLSAVFMIGFIIDFIRSK